MPLGGVPTVRLCIPHPAWYTLPMIETELESLEVGGLWREVVNFLGSRTIEPALYLALLDTVLPPWKAWTYFLGRAAESLANDRAELEADAARARLGWRLWVDRRDALRRFAESVAARQRSVLPNRHRPRILS